MSPEILREVFLRGVRHASMAIVEGSLDPHPLPVDLRRPDRPGRLAPIVESLNLSSVAILAAAPILENHLPAIPREVEAIILDGVEDPERLGFLKRVVEALSGRPVIAAVDALPEARLALKSEDPCRVSQAVAALAQSFASHADFRALANLARSRPLPAASDDVGPLDRGGRFRVAYAHDAAFGGYCPDTLETLETLGAELVEFSPLRDERLPENVDLVLLGCGYPDLHADALAANLSLITALRCHVCQGRRIYAEGGGTAYLGRAMILQGRRVAGVGIFPFDAELRDHPNGPSPVSRTLIRANWLGPRGTTVRGYRSGRWRLRPAPESEDCPARSGPLTAAHDMYFRYNAVGSLIHLHLASLPEVVAAFARTSNGVAGPTRAKV